MLQKAQEVFQRIGSWIVRFFDRTLSGTAAKQFFLLSSGFILLYLFWLLIGYIFLPESLHQINKDIPGPGWSIIAQMIDPGNQHQIGVSTSADAPLIVSWKLRLFVLVLSISGTFVFSGLLISTITNVFEKRVALVREGLVNYYFSNHIVVLGYHDITKGLILQLLRNQIDKPCKIVVLTEGNVPDIRQSLRSEVTKQQFKYLHILAGKRTSVNDLNRCGVTRAIEIYIHGDRDENDHDPKSNDCILKIDNILKSLSHSPTTAIPCYVLFDSQTTHLLYQHGNIRPDDNTNFSSCLNIQSFSFYEAWARKVFIDSPEENGYSTLDFEPIEADSDKYVHLIIAGMTRMGFALAVQAARIGHYANYQRQKTRITFIDAEAERERDFFASRYQSFYDAVDADFLDLSTGEKTMKHGRLPFINISLSFIKGKFESPKVRDQLLHATSDPNALTTIAITFLSPSANLAGALYLPEEIYNRKVRVLVKQDSKHSAVSLSIPDQNIADARFKFVKAFGMLDECPGLVCMDDFEAKLVNHFYYSGNQLPTYFNEETYKTIQKQWDGLPERHKWSSRNNAESIVSKLRIGALVNPSYNSLKELFTPKVIDLLALIEHARWNADTLLMGFRPPLKEVLDYSNLTADEITAAMAAGESEEQITSIKKTHENYVKPYKNRMIHPCLVSYDQLSDYYKDIDRRLVSAIPIIKQEHANRTKKDEKKY